MSRASRNRFWAPILLSMTLYYGGAFRSRFRSRTFPAFVPMNTTGTLGPGGPQFSYGTDYCRWLLELPHDPSNPYDDLGGES